MVTLYDLVLRIEYSFTNQTAAGALFFNVKKEF
jgi:hypothetical protein